MVWNEWKGTSVDKCLLLMAFLHAFLVKLVAVVFGIWLCDNVYYEQQCKIVLDGMVMGVGVPLHLIVWGIRGRFFCKERYRSNFH